MILLSETKNSEIDFILAPQPYVGLYSKLSQILSKEYIAFFARPREIGNKTRWYFETRQKINRNKIKSYNSLNEQEKNIVSDYLEYNRPKILSILSREKEFKKFYKEFFTIPDTDDIKVIFTDHEPIIILTKWACKSIAIVSSVDKITGIINRPKPDREKVIIDIKYTDGSVATDRQFYFSYTGYQLVEKKRKTDNKGQRSFGKFKFGSQISVYDIIDNKKEFVHNFTVKEGQQIYEVIFPLFVDAKVKVINQKNEIIPQTDVVVEYENENYVRNTQKYGFFSLENLEVGKEVKISEKENPENTKTYTVKKQRNEFILKILQPFFEDATIKIVNQKNEALANRTLLLEYESKDIERKEHEHIADKSAQIKLEEILVGSQIKASEKDNPSNIQTYILTEQENEFIFKIYVPEPKQIKIKIIDHKKKVVKNKEIKIIFREKEYELITDESGYCILEVKEIEDGEKLKVIIKTNKKDRIRKLKYIK